MIDFSISSGQLMLIWSFAGAVCCLPFFTKNRWQHFVIVPIIFLAIFLSFETNHNFIGKPLRDLYLSVTQNCDKSNGCDGKQK